MQSSSLPLRSPHHLAAAVPYLVGFTPESSIVVTAFKSHPDHSPALVVTARYDMPTPEQQPQMLEEMARTLSARADVALVMIAAPPEASRPGDTLPHRDLAREINTALADAGMQVPDVLLLDDDRVWSYLCEGPDCPCPSGERIPESIRTEVAAEFIAAGAAPVASRDSLAAELKPRDDRAQFIRPLLNAQRASDMRAVLAGDPIRARRAVVAAVHAITSPSDMPYRPLDDREIARIGAAFDDIRVRDTYLWDLTNNRPPGMRPTTAATLADAVRALPPGHRAPTATVLAVVHWQSGDGARANAALDVAAADDPDYSLAQLVRGAQRAGLPPSHWADAMRDLTRERCLTGIDTGTPTPAPVVTPSVTPPTVQPPAL